MLTWGEFGEGVGDCCGFFFPVTCLTSMNFYLMEKSNLCHVFYSFRFHLPWHWGCGMCSCWKETGCWPLWRITSWKCTEVSRIRLVHWLVYSAFIDWFTVTDWLFLSCLLPLCQKNLRAKPVIWKCVPPTGLFSSKSNSFLYECLAQDSFWNKGTRLTWKWSCVFLFTSFYKMVKYFIGGWKVTIKSAVYFKSCSKTVSSVYICNKVFYSTVSELHSRPRVWPPRRTLNIILFPFCHRNLRQDGPWGSGAVFARKDACVPVWWWWSYRDAPGHDVRVETFGIGHPAGP